MRILDRYIGMTIARSVVVVMIVLLALFTFADFMQELEEVGKGRYTLDKALLFVAMTVPGRMLELFPVAALIGSVSGLGWLASSSELIVIRAVGVSIRRIALSVMKVGGILMVISVALGELVAPPLEEYAHSMRSIAMSGQIALRTRHGLWSRDGDTFVNVRRILPGGRLQQLYLYEFDEAHRLKSFTYADSATYENKRWRLHDLTEKHFEDQRVTTVERDHAEWRALLSPKQLDVLLVNPEDLAAVGLYRYIRYLQNTEQDARRYELAFWKKVMTPIATAIMVFLAIPFVFGPLRSVTVGQRVTTGTLVGVGFHLFNQMFGQFGLLYGLSPLVSATLPLSVALGLALWMARTVR